MDFLTAGIFSLALGADVIHDTTPLYTEVRYTKGPYSTWVGLDEGDGLRVGVDGKIYSKGPVSFHLGTILARKDDEVGTLARYELRLAWTFGKVGAIELIHESNCRSICRDVPGLSILPHGPDGKSNSGENKLVWRFNL